VHLVTIDDISLKNDEIQIFCPSLIFCCYGSKNLSITQVLIG